jgi:hypothetical protein
MTKMMLLKRFEWRGIELDNWMVMAGIQMSDKPFFINYGQSVPLDERFGRSRMRNIPKPLVRWRRTIERLEHHRQNILVHICPLNANGNHYTLLEINEREGVIYHYDSMAYQEVINGSQHKQTRVGKAVQVRISFYDCDPDVTNVILGGVWPSQIRLY